MGICIIIVIMGSYNDLGMICSYIIIMNKNGYNYE